MKKLLLGLAVATMASTMSAHAGQFTTETDYFHCDPIASTPIGNVNVVTDNSRPSWNEATPTNSLAGPLVIGAAGVSGTCGFVAAGAVTGLNYQSIYDLMATGSFTGDLDSMTLSFYGFWVGPSDLGLLPDTIRFHVGIDGKSMFGNASDTTGTMTGPNSASAVVTPKSTATPGLLRFDLSVTGLNFIGDGSEEHTIELTANVSDLLAVVPPDPAPRRTAGLGFGYFPIDAIVPSAFECEAGGFAEDYFRSIRGKNICAGECGSGAHAQPRHWERHQDDAPEITPGTAQLLRCEVASEIRSQAGKRPGSVPLGWERWAEEMLDPKVDWRRALGAAVRSGVASVAGCVDYSYMSPSRRASVTGNVILPALRKPLPTIAVVVDTSASMSERLLGEVVPQVEAILRGAGVGHSRVHLLACDSEVHEVRRVTSTRQVKLFGGGGTDMGAGIASALELRPRPSVVVVLTDGDTPWPAARPKGTRVVVGLVGFSDTPVPARTKKATFQRMPQN